MTETEHIENLNKISSSPLSPCGKEDEESSEKIEVNNPPGFSMEVELISVEIGRGLICLVDKNPGERYFLIVSLQ